MTNSNGTCLISHALIIDLKLVSKLSEYTATFLEITNLHGIICYVINNIIDSAVHASSNQGFLSTQ